MRAATTTVGALALAAVALGLLGCSSDPGAAAPPPPRPATHTVDIEGLQFKPAALTVRAGDTIVWANKDMFPHTATAESGFDSKSIDSGKSWQMTAAGKGDFTYVCTFHPTMKATLRVE